MIEHYLDICEVDENSFNGHVTVCVRVIEVDTETGAKKIGPMVKHGIEHEVLHQHHEGDVDKWLNHVGAQMLDRHAKHPSSLGKLRAHVGKQLKLNAKVSVSPSSTLNEGLTGKE